MGTRARSPVRRRRDLSALRVLTFGSTRHRRGAGRSRSRVRRPIPRGALSPELSGDTFDLAPIVGLNCGKGSVAVNKFLGQSCSLATLILASTWVALGPTSTQVGRAAATGGPACTITVAAGATVTRGTEGDDVICGRQGFETIQALGGNDVIYGRGGADLILGEAGSDTIFGGSGYDLLRGEGGSDRLYGEAGDDRLDGGPRERGADVLLGGGGNDYLTGHGGNDALTGGAGNDQLRAGDGNDRLFSRDGRRDSVVHGGPGFDRGRVDRRDYRFSIERLL
jgi:hypothetical protein